MEKIWKYLKYKGYTGSVETSEEDDVYFGRVQDLKHAIISYEGKTIKELEKDFHEAIDFYLDSMKEDGEQPEKPSKTMTTVTIELDDELVEKTKQVLANYGLDLNTATILFYSYVVNNGKLPFELNKIFQDEVKKYSSRKEQTSNSVDEDHFEL